MSANKRSGGNPYNLRSGAMVLRSGTRVVSYVPGSAKTAKRANTAKKESCETPPRDVEMVGTDMPDDLPLFPGCADETKCDERERRYCVIPDLTDSEDECEDVCMVCKGYLDTERDECSLHAGKNEELAYVHEKCVSDMTRCAQGRMSAENFFAGVF